MECSIKAMIDRMRKVMSEEKITAVQLAAMTETPLSTLGKVLRFETKEPSVSLVIDVAKALNVSADWLLGLSEYRNPSEEMTLSKMKEFGDKDSYAVEVYRRFVECTDQYKVFYAECFGVNRSDNGEFQPQMCEVVYSHVKDVISSYNEMYDYISACTTEETLKECITMINKCLDNISEARNSIVEEAFRIYNERTGTTSVTKTYDVTAYTQNIAAGTGEEGFTAEKIEEVESFARQIAEIEGNGTV